MVLEEVFPAGAGMNRHVPRWDPVQGVPRRRGDEPPYCRPDDKPDFVFPAGAGMNRRGHVEPITQRVPRRRGDEPP